MANKSDRRKKARAQKRSAKEQRMVAVGGKSKYALKHKQQSGGRYLPTSPFYLTPAQREEALRYFDDNSAALPAFARLG